MKRKKRKSIFKGVLSTLLCLCMALPAMGSSVSAEDEEYTYQFPAENDTPYYDMSMFAYQIGESTDPDAEAFAASVRRLIDEDGNEHRVYCADADILENYGVKYKAVPLEESEYTKDSAEHLRAVIQNSYPYITADQVIAKVKGDGKTLNDGLIPSYTMMLMSATEQSIYHFTNPDFQPTYRFASYVPWEEYSTFYKSYVEVFHDDYSYFTFESGASSNYYNIFNATKADIEVLFDWYTKLPGQKAPEVTADCRFEVRAETAGDNYNLTLYNLSDDVINGKELKVSVSKENSDDVVYSGGVEVNDDNTITVSFASDAVKPGDNIKVTLTGGKPYEDIVAYESAEDPSSGTPASQPFIGEGILLKDFTDDVVTKIPEKISVPVEKIWADADDTHTDSVTVRLQADGKDTGKSLELTEDNHWKGEFTELDATKNGAKIQYTVEEDAVVGFESNVDGNMDTGFEITNVSRGNIYIKPADITIYMGGNEGYDAVVGSGSDILDTNNSLPTPLFHIYTPKGVQPEDIRFVSGDVIPGTDVKKEWTVSAAGETRDGETLYYLNKANDAQDDVRVQYTINGTGVTNDRFDPNDVRDLFEDYTTTLYAGTVAINEVRAVDNQNNDYMITLGEGTLRVRAVENGDGTEATNPVYLVQANMPTERLAAETAAVVAPEGTTYTLNHTTVPAGPDGIGLLFDNIYDKDNGKAERENALISATDELIGPAGEDVTRWHQAKYLDLVDENNGNAWVKTTNGQAVTVVWGYPEGTDENTSFTLLHYAGLHRDDADGANSGYTVDDISAVVPEEIDIRKSAAGIEFDVPSGGFSPFVLVWETKGSSGNLTVSKTVSGNAGDRDRDWNFTVTLSDRSINGDYGDLTFTDGKASFKLKHNQSKTAINLPAGVTYQAAEAEANRDGYKTSSNAANGTIRKGDTAFAEFTNTKTAEVSAPQTGDNFSPGLWIGFLLLGVLAAAGFTAYRKRG